MQWIAKVYQVANQTYGINGSSCFLLSTGTGKIPLHYIILSSQVCKYMYYYSHFTDEETETQQYQVICPRSHKC